jgi:hypothetical protein
MLLPSAWWHGLRNRRHTFSVVPSAMDHHWRPQLQRYDRRVKVHAHLLVVSAIEASTAHQYWSQPAACLNVEHAHSLRTV